MLISFLILISAHVSGQQWVGVSSQSPLSSTITFSGSTSSSAEISVEIPGFYLNETISAGKKYHSVEIPGDHPILIQGCPDIRKLSLTLQLPANGNLEVVPGSSKYIEYNDIDLLPSAGDVPRDGSSSQLIEGDQYTQAVFYPGTFISSDQPFIIRNQRAQAFHIFPMQYNPVTRVLRFYYQLNFHLSNTGGMGINPLFEKDLNIKPVEGIAESYPNSVNNAFKSGTLPSETGSLLIICPENFINAISPLVDWRRQSGIATEVVHSEQFDDADDIYDFVKNYYYNNGNLAYLLLVGDASQIPPYKFPYGSSDNYYSYLSGNDHYPDILVGRFSAETVKDVETQVNRTLLYEKNPGTNTSWITNATGLGSTLTPGDDGEADYQHIRNLLKTLVTTSYSKANEFFDGSQGELDAEGNPSAADVTKKINEGTGVIFYAGHGSPSSWGTGTITKSVAENLDNYGKYPLIWSAACETGNFAEKYCLAEAWLRSTNGSGQPAGAVAALMSSGTQTSYPPMEAQDKIADIMSKPSQQLSTMGAITVKGMMSMNDVYGSAGYNTTDCWILFGDPSLRVRTAQPLQLIVEHKGRIGSGRSIYSLKCNSADGYACISNNGTILGTASISEGMSTIYMDQPASGDSLLLTVTALNYLPYVANIQVIKNPGTPDFCLPLNHSKLQPINSTFSWESGDGGNPEYYMFYLGTDNPPTNLINGEKLTSTQFKTEYNFKYNKKYFWRVVAVNNFGISDGKVMDFTTVFAPDEDFEPVFKSRLKWNDGGMQKWTGDNAQFFDGTNSIRSGVIGDNEYSSLIYPCEVTNCDFVSFWYKTSSEPGDKLQFIIDGAVAGEWSGETGWDFHIYKVEAGSHQLEWRYSKNALASGGDDAAWLDNIHLPVHAPAVASVEENASVCEGSAFETSATADNYFSITWSSEGDGKFEDNNLTDAVYQAGFMDILNTNTRLQMFIHGFDGCPVISKNLNLEINPVPHITLPSDTIVSNGSVVELDASITGNMSYNWPSIGISQPRAVIDSSLSVNGTKTTTLIITSDKGCSASKDIKIHFNNPALADRYTIFPNPSNGNFTLKPLKGTAIINEMKLIDKEGRTVWNESGSCTIVDTRNISIQGISSGAYFLVTENENGQAVNPVIIK